MTHRQPLSEQRRHAKERGSRAATREHRSKKAERRCPQCGAERGCMGYDVTEVIELVPAHLDRILDATEMRRRWLP